MQKTVMLVRNKQLCLWKVVHCVETNAKCIVSAFVKLT